MPTKQKRYSLKAKQAKLILNDIADRLKINLESLFWSKANVEVVEADFGEIYLVNGKPLLFKFGGRVLPTLFFQEFALQAPKIVVDMGAVPYVCNGADVMAPGIRRVNGEFAKGDLALIVDEKYGKPIALGESLYEAESVRNIKQGAVVKNLHFVSDKVWNLIKSLAEN